MGDTENLSFEVGEVVHFRGGTFFSSGVVESVPDNLALVSVRRGSRLESWPATLVRHGPITQKTFVDSVNNTLHQSLRLTGDYPEEPITPVFFEQLFRSVCVDAVAKQLWVAAIDAGLDPEAILGRQERAVVSGRVNEGGNKRTPSELEVGDRLLVDLDGDTYVVRVAEILGNGTVTIEFRGLASSGKSWRDMWGRGMHF